MNAQSRELTAVDADQATGLAPLVLALTATGGLYLLSVANYLLFHSVAELFSVLVAFSTFAIAWNSRRFLSNGYLLFLGIAYLFVGVVDLVHALTYQGMGIYPESGANLPTQLWIAARYLESGSLVAATLFFDKRLNHRLTLAGYGLGTILIFWSVGRPGLFPDCFVEGSGLTPFKIGSEYLICLLLAGALILLRRRRDKFTPQVFCLLVGAILLTIVAELAFTFYVSVYGLSNLIGHIFKIASVYLIYRAIIQTGLVRPYELIFRNLKQSEAALAAANTELENRVAERTVELTRTNTLLQREVEEHRRAEEKLELLAAIVESSTDAIIGQDLAGTILSWNRGAEALYGYPADEVVGRSIALLLPPAADDELQPLLTRIQAGERVDRHETIRVGKGGNRVEVSLTLSPIRNRQGHIVGVSSIARDISPRKKLEAQLRQAQKMEAIGTLTGGIAHDFNNVLTAIIGFANMVEMKLAKDHPLHGHVTQILAAADRAANLTRSLLAFSRKQPVEIKPVDLNELLSGLGKMLRRLIPESIELKLEPAAEELTIRADGGQIEQVLLNLATNARDALAAGGAVRVTTARVELDEDYCTAHGFGAAGGYALLTFADNGPGMAESVRQHIFEPFFTTKEVGKGTGLGLAVCYGIVEQHQGHISCYSEPGRGTTFRIYLPLTEDPATAATGADVAPPAGGTETILLAEDDEAVRLFTIILLEEAGYTVVAARDGCEAVDHGRKLAGNFHLCLFDLTMPRQGGWEAFLTIREFCPAIKALFMSGYPPDAKRQEELLDTGAGFIAKPVRPRELLQKIRETLDQPANKSARR